MRIECLSQIFEPTVDPAILRVFHYDSISIETGYRPVGFRFSPHIVNIEATLAGQKLIVTGEADTMDLACAKANSELVERSALLSIGCKFGVENSNGWAAHPDKNEARSNAILELIERDAVLSQWYSSTSFFEIFSSDWPMDVQNWAASELAKSEFPRMRILISTRGLGPSVTCLFMNDSGFGVSAHSTRTTLDGSIRSAITEACRPALSSIRREHWKNTIKLRDGVGSPLASEAHAVYYAYHEPFPQWMFGKLIKRHEAQQFWQQRMSAVYAKENQFEFITVMASPLFVGFALHPNAFQLRWGNTDSSWLESLAGIKRLGIEKDQINKSIHIVS